MLQHRRTPFQNSYRIEKNLKNIVRTRSFQDFFDFIYMPNDHSPIRIIFYRTLLISFFLLDRC